jgi:probable DNA metabolism protein
MMRLEDKLALLADAAKYDVSCASSGSRRRNSGSRLGNAAPSGICHTYTEDGRCVSLLKLLFTNACIYDCAYCVNRAGNDIPRAAFTPTEIISLCIDFYRRNYIEGLFLSSGIAGSPNDTMERLVATVKGLRREGFNGYIHLKCVPNASRRLVQAAGRHADRLSVNIELPSEASLRRLTREKSYPSILTPMETIRESIAETRAERRKHRRLPPFAPAGQSTQLIIGASPESDHDILALANRLYRRLALKRVYYSAYVPVTSGTDRIGAVADPPLRRENRLYQADWLLRLYGFTIEELISAEAPFLDLSIDPKQAFALRHPERFPIDVNRADREQIMKVPGIGLTSAHRIAALRRGGRIRFEHLKQLGVVVSRARPFIACDGLPGAQWQGASLTPPAGTVTAPLSPRPKRSVSVSAPRLVFEVDGTFDGLLTAIFEACQSPRPPDAINAASGRQRALFDHSVTIATDTAKSKRVWKRLKTRLGDRRPRRLFEAFLSRAPDVETAIYQVVMALVRKRGGRRHRAHLSAQIRVDKLAGKVRREAHRMKGLVRFQQTEAGRYLALIAPRYDVLPLICRHFETRFADQRWIIGDTRRHYGICYDKGKTRIVPFDAGEAVRCRRDPAGAERLCQQLWRRYYRAASIAQRTNPRLHLRNLPRRYWAHLPEKQV